MFWVLLKFAQSGNSKKYAELHVFCGNFFLLISSVLFLIRSCVICNIYLFQNGWTALHNAAYWCHPRVVEMLIKKGCDVNLENKVPYMSSILLLNFEFGNIFLIIWDPGGKSLGKRLPVWQCEPWSDCRIKLILICLAWQTLFSFGRMAKFLPCTSIHLIIAFAISSCI